MRWELFTTFGKKYKTLSSLYRQIDIYIYFSIIIQTWDKTTYIYDALSKNSNKIKHIMKNKPYCVPKYQGYHKKG